VVRAKDGPIIGLSRLQARLGLFIFALFLLAYLFWLSRSFAELDALRKEEIGLKTDFIRKQEQSALGHIYQQQLVLLQAQLDDHWSNLPADNWTTQILATLTTSTSSLGLRFQLFSPAKEVNHGSYHTIMLKMILIGSYHQLALWLSQLAKMQLLAVHEFSLRVQSDMSLLMHLTLIFYRYPKS
jgi:type IV pilus assembly protein PilO